MKLIDIGAFNGDSALHFISYPDIDSIDAYEPNEDFNDLWGAIEQFYPNIRFFNKAVYTYTGEIEFYKRPGELPLGSTIMKSKIQDAPHETQMIPCVDILEIIPEKKFCLKVDAEGAEYDILARLIDSGKSGLVDRLYVEWHDRKMITDNLVVQDRIISHFGDRIKPWL